MNFTLIYLWVTQKISSQYEHFYYRINNNEKNYLLAEIYVSSALGGVLKNMIDAEKKKVHEKGYCSRGHPKY